jgi:hypothetical protein
LELIMKKKRELTTRRMSSGAQQFVREGAEMGPREMSSSTTRRMKTIDDTIRATRRLNPEAENPLNEAFIDESRSAQRARETERQTFDEDRANRRGARKFAEGGEVRGCSGSQMSGKGFRGNY